MEALVTPAWLADHGDEVRLLDASYTLPGADARAAFDAGHIPGALFLDLDTLVDTADPLPNTIPAAALVAERLGALGIANDTPVVLYDDVAHRTAARAWWVLTSFGQRNVAILDGGLAAWRVEGRPVETGPAERPASARFEARLDPARFRDLAQVKAIVVGGTEQLLDARSAARFTGAEADPRADVAPGHMPGAANLPYAALFTPDGRWKRGDALAAAFAQAGVDWSRPLVTTCGSGITAAVLAFGAHLLGHEAALYDASWSEWGADPTTPKATGDAA